MIGLNPTPELRNYSHIIIANIKAFIFKHKLKIQITRKLTRFVTVAKFRVETGPYRAEITAQRLTPKILCLFGKTKLNNALKSPPRSDLKGLYL